MKHSLAVVAVLLGLSGCGGSDSQSPSQPTPPPTMKADKCFTFDTTKGKFNIAIDSTNTPITGKNFIDYADAGFYNNTIFHRVINNFVIQGGGFESGLKPKQTRAPIKNEASVGFTNARGTIAMARTQAPDSATSQFFINTLNNPQLDHSASRIGYAVFGKVTSGMEVVDQISVVETETRGRVPNVPVKDVTLNSVKAIDCQ